MMNALLCDLKRFTVHDGPEMEDGSFSERLSVVLLEANATIASVERT